MAHTNETTNYHLSQFIGTDIPNPLTDYNGDMEKIDLTVKAVADSAVLESARVTALETQNGDAVLTTTAQTLSGAVNELDSDLGGVDARLVTAEGKIVSDEATLGTAVDNISTLAGKVSGLETKVGNAVLTTTASDCSGAINELDADVDGIKPRLITSVTYDGVKTRGEGLDELYNSASAIISALSDVKKYHLSYVQKDVNGVYSSHIGSVQLGGQYSRITATMPTSGGNTVFEMHSTNSVCVLNKWDGTTIDYTSNVVPAGYVDSIYLN